MKLSTAALALLAALAEAAQFTNTESDFSGITAGKPITFTWSGASGAVTLTLRDGDPSALGTVQVIQSGITGSSYTWTPPASLGANVQYALSITDSSGTNYSKQFTISGATGSASVASSTGTTTVASSTTGTTTTSTSASTTTTTNSSSSSSSKTSTSSSSSTSSTSKPTNTNAGQKVSSPLALVLVTVAALLYFN